MIQRLLRSQDTPALQALLALELLDADTLAQGGVLARRAENAPAAALLADAERRRRASAPKRPRYDFDF